MKVSANQQSGLRFLAVSFGFRDSYNYPKTARFTRPARLKAWD